jgi:hypothetical protein
MPDGVARLQDGEVHRLVGLGAGVRLHVGVFGTKQLLHAVDGQLLDHVHVFTATVKTLGRIAFSVLVGQLGALGFHHCGAGIVFGSDQFNMIFLALALGLDSGGQFRVELGNRLVSCKHL